jgi:hypothetical protein
VRLLSPATVGGGNEGATGDNNSSPCRGSIAGQRRLVQGVSIVVDGQREFVVLALIGVFHRLDGRIVLARGINQRPLAVHGADAFTSGAQADGRIVGVSGH